MSDLDSPDSGRLPTFQYLWRLATGVDRIGPTEPAAFARQLGTLLQSNVLLLKALDLIAQNAETPAFARAVGRIQARVASGLPLSRALADHPGIFSPEFIATVRAGELGGDPGRFLLHLADRLEVWQNFRGRASGVPSLLTGRNFILLVALAIGAMALLQTDLFSVAAAALVFFVVPMAAMFGLVAAAYLGFRVLGWVVKGLARLMGAGLAARLLHRLPIAGPLLMKGAAGRFCWTLGVLISSGVSMAAAVEAASQVSGDQLIRSSLNLHLPRLRAGKPLARLLKEDGVFPFFVIQMIAVGEETGDLGRLMLTVAEAYDAEIDGFLDGIGAMVPFLVTTFFIFALVAWFYFAFLGPLWGEYPP